jgi:hypothetical protein
VRATRLSAWQPPIASIEASNALTSRRPSPSPRRWFTGKESELGWKQLPEFIIKVDTLVNELKAVVPGLQRVDSRSNAMCTCYPGSVSLTRRTPMQQLRIGREGFGIRVGDELTRPNSLDCSAYRGLHVRHESLDLFIVQGLFSVAPCQTLIVTIRNFSTAGRALHPALRQPKHQWANLDSDLLHELRLAAGGRRAAPDLQLPEGRQERRGLHRLRRRQPQAVGRRASVRFPTSCGTQRVVFV